MRAGLALVPENRKEDGLILMQTVRDNITLPNLDALAGALGAVRRDRASEMASSYVESPHDPHAEPAPARRIPLWREPAENRPGEVARLEPKVLILDEPTRGIDVGAKSEVHALMSQLAEAGSASS